MITLYGCNYVYLYTDLGKFKKNIPGFGIFVPNTHQNEEGSP